MGVGWVGSALSSIHTKAEGFGVNKFDRRTSEAAHLDDDGSRCGKRLPVPLNTIKFLTMPLVYWLGVLNVTVIKLTHYTAPNQGYWQVGLHITDKQVS